MAEATLYVDARACCVAVSFTSPILPARPEAEGAPRPGVLCAARPGVLGAARPGVLGELLGLEGRAPRTLATANAEAAAGAGALARISAA